MDTEQYRQVQEQVAMLANLVKAMPLAEFIEVADRADTLGPILDPTLWREGSKNLALIMGLARGLREFQVTANRLLEQEGPKCSSPERR